MSRLLASYSACHGGKPAPLLLAARQKFSEPCILVGLRSLDSSVRFPGFAGRQIKMLATPTTNGANEIPATNGTALPRREREAAFQRSGAQRPVLFVRQPASDLANVEDAAIWDDELVAPRETVWFEPLVHICF
jgi:hypothetical protein